MSVEDIQTQHHHIGASAPRPDAWEKAAGRGIYAADYYVPDMTFAGLKRAMSPHARLTSLDVSEALAVSGVLAVLTHEDVPGANVTGLIHKNQPVLAKDTIRRQGEPVALVVAEAPESLEAALDVIRVELEELPGVFETESALAPGAPLLHEAHPGNLMAEIAVEKGQGAQALDICPLLVATTIELPRQEHAFLET